MKSFFIATVLVKEYNNSSFDLGVTIWESSALFGQVNMSRSISFNP